MNLESYFSKFRRNVIGLDQHFETPFGVKKMLYADWTASGRLYKPIEDKIANEFGPFLGNTHTETSVTGSLMTQAYKEAKRIIKAHVNAGPDDAIIVEGSGMTGVVNKLQRILGLKVPERFSSLDQIPPDQRPVVFVTHMEHHSNHTSWLETIADVEIINPDKKGMVNLDHFAELLEKFKYRQQKIAAITDCSNVTGIRPCTTKLAKMIHKAGGLCFVDYACSAPYVKIDMHPEDPLEKFDAIYFSPHKFLGGPGTPGVLIFDSRIYGNRIPDCPGGGTVLWTNAWGERHYFDDIEIREDGGTPPFLQTIRAALAVKLKEEMNIEKILQREEEMLHYLFPAIKAIPNLHILAGHIEDRLAVISFYIDGLHYNLGVRLLNDLYGIQVRGGCSCAGTYGHYLLDVSYEQSRAITDTIDSGDLSSKPGWIRLSLHPVMRDEEVAFLIAAIRDIAENFREYSKDYNYDPHTNEFTHQSHPTGEKELVEKWFTCRFD